MSTAHDPSDPTDPIPLARALIARPSVTPEDAGALDLIETRLRDLGFSCERLRYASAGPVIDNLYARLGGPGPCLLLAGHTDVVPVGSEAGWTHPPFAGAIADGRLWGRGAADMKGALAAMLAALARHLGRHGPPQGSIALLVTGDEEGDAIDGTRACVVTLKARGARFDHCLIGEPTNPDSLGDMIKIGRRGSVNIWLTVTGTQGHVAYPHLACNPVPVLVEILSTLSARRLDAGTEHFDPSNLELTDLAVGNPATNVIPARADGRLNIRFNTAHTAQALIAWVRETAETIATRRGARLEMRALSSGEAFYCAPGRFTDLLSKAIAAETGRSPALSTTGGTSDGRFLKDLCPVAEFGLVGRTMHKVDENVALADIETLTRIYARVLEGYFA
ncbi:MAG: succinyl-diaminopimelate desuccinylase [Alphaproteobacteria bacterium]|nr:succinyl-diaminopimelate desuccinylase [Alphaproteobacteria bacterium]